MHWKQDLRSKLQDGLIPALVLFLLLIMSILLVQPIQNMTGRPGLLIYILSLMALSVYCLEHSLQTGRPDTSHAWFGMAGGLLGWFPRRVQAWATGGFAASMAAISVAALVWGLIPPFAPPGEPRAAQVAAAKPVNTRIGLLELSGVAWDSPEPGQLTLYWRAVEKPAADLRTDLRALDASGALLWEWKRSPGAGRYSTDRWPVGRVVADTYRLPPDVVGRVATVQVGLRPFPEGPWLPVAGLPDGQLLTLPK